MGKFGSTSGTYLSIRAKARGVYGYARRQAGDAKGVTRHAAGAIPDTMFGYLPVTPTPGLVCVDTEIWNFQTQIDVLTDAVDPIIYMWEETMAGGGGTPLALVDTPGGACTLTTGPTEGDSIMYQGPLGTVSFDTAFWFVVGLELDDALSGGFFIGLSDEGGNPLAAAGIGSDKNSVGIGTLPGHVDFLLRLASPDARTWTYSGSHHIVESNLRMEIGVKWVPKGPLLGVLPVDRGGTIYWYRNNYLLAKRTISSDEKPEGGLRVTFTGVTGDGGEVTFRFHRIIAITAHPAVCEDTGA